MNVNNVKKYKSITLHTIGNKSLLGYIPVDFLTDFKSNMNSINEITLEIPKFNGKDNDIFSTYDDIREERYLCLDREEYFVIKNIKESNGVKIVTAFSSEKKLSRMDIEVEDIYFTLDESAHNDEMFIIYLGKYLYDETGWNLRTISSSVKYNFINTLEDILNGSNPIIDTSSSKIRYQENVNTNWYDFITKDIAEQFGCFPIFISKTKEIDLLSEDDFGDELQLFLSYDNYIKSLEKEGSTENICTRLTLKGNEELTILEVTPTGYKFVENFDYFINNGEMSDDLILAINLYNSMLNERRITWLQLVDQKNETQERYNTLNTELFFIFTKIKSLELEISTYENLSGTEEIVAKKKVELEKYKTDKDVKTVDINVLYDQLQALTSSILNIQMLCRRETSTDKNGNRIFNQSTLDELKEFVYHDTYANDSYTDPKLLLQRGLYEVKNKSFPIITWNIDVLNFLDKLEDNGFRQHWNGELNLGDMIYLRGKYNDDCIIYIIGYTIDYKNNKLMLELSNKRSEVDGFKKIGDRLTESKQALRKINGKQYLLNRQKYNRINLDYKK